MRIVTVTVTVTVTVALALLVRSARADRVWHDGYESPLSSWSAHVYDQSVKRRVRASLKVDSRTTNARANVSASDFRRSKSSTDVVAHVVANARLPDAAAAELRAELRSTMARIAAAGRKDNVANALAMAITLSMIVLEKPEYDLAKADELVTNVNDALAASPRFRRLGPAERQVMYDSALLSAAVIALVHQSGDKAASQAIAKNVLLALTGD
ncbi:MAG: DUF6683 family protein [Kofleriaceae bacterium]